MTTDIRIAQLIGTLGCGITAGGMMCLSVVTVPALSLPPRHPPSATLPEHEFPATPVTHLSRQWLYVYERGKSIFPPIAIVASTANAYLAWRLYDVRVPERVGCSWSSLYIAAIGTTLGIIPWTLTAMKTVNGHLKAHAVRDDASMAEGSGEMVVSAKEKAMRAKQDEQVPGLMQDWAWLNLCRAVFPLIGGAIGFAGAICMDSI
ncbi:hypothetical protein N7481_010818 [Penicillium waksmanii]|uniref:uncharacterized protein n=1 Tax=Penicillium waksmanii TaxID=69791 RepID=UPI002548DFCD|nr:uncharacterized protein N7481_010818 [Penicillium waksmanii]KAJ5973608.1 hypothetical protein N7481_010818 [Penicillium waksmanii]